MVTLLVSLSMLALGRGQAAGHCYIPAPLAVSLIPIGSYGNFTVPVWQGYLPLP